MAYLFVSFAFRIISLYTHVEHNDTMKTSDTVFRKIYLPLYLKGLCVREGVGDRTELQYIDPALMTISVVCSRSPDAQPEARGSSFLLSAGFLYHILSLTGLVSKQTDFLSSPSYIIVQSPIQYLPITGHQDASLPLSLEWHV